MRNDKKSLVKAPDPVFVSHLANAVTSSGLGAFSGLKEEMMATLPDPQDVGLQSPITDAVTDRYVASEPQAVESPSQAAWRIISEWNLAKGYVTSESLKRLSQVLHPEVRLED